MKKILTAIMAIMLSTSLFAGTAEEKRLASDMRMMLDAIVDMQKAAYYNDSRVLKASTNRLISGLDSMLAVPASTYLEKNQKYAEKFAEKRVKMIKMYAEDLLMSLESGKIDDVIDDYHNISKECYSCHVRIRRN
jgi:cytochrome c556